MNRIINLRPLIQFDDTLEIYQLEIDKLDLII